ncbi:aminotransferase class I/II-fold pyridoxal phosphate-dependent enzyme [Dyella silvatica]|uniref:aminotransferase class I/II-fold pyridoxal phosphate-dependent enzyme n=1 Tax=Dyella silvatica TaxID=2992128 RepID=UPI0022528F7F|nr:aminotransferase class I/II-fold pyridoxal phosphate-dependent enzyme [Dyella silvatica]
MRDFALEVHFSQWEFKARYNMAASDLQSLTLGELLHMATPEDRANFERSSLGYTETWGSPSLRSEIAKTYENLSAEQILCFCGAQEGIYVAMRALLDEGDHAIVVVPNYQSAETIPLSICAVTGVSLDSEHHWHLDIEKLAAAIRPNTKLISINFPNNPTGHIIPPASFEAIVALCRQHDLWLFSDEVYRLIERDPHTRLAQAADVYEKGISLNVMSKAYGLPGLRIGWLACQDRSMLIRFERYKHYLSICNAAPSEHLACMALKAREAILQRNRGIVENNIGVLDAFFAEFSELFDWHVPDGGCIGFIRYNGADGVESFTRRLVEEAGVLLLPASVYRSDLDDVPNHFFRIGFGRSFVPEGIQAMREWLKAQAGRAPR